MQTDPQQQQIDFDDAAAAARAQYIVDQIQQQLPGYGVCLWIANMMEDANRGLCTLVSTLDRQCVVDILEGWLTAVINELPPPEALEVACWTCGCRGEVRKVAGQLRTIFLCPTCMGLG